MKKNLLKIITIINFKFILHLMKEIGQKLPSK